MATKVEMPQMGESVVEGTILTWLKHEGDDVAVDDALVEVSTDKVDTEIPSPVAGKLTKILVQEGETVEIGTALCEVDESGGGEAPAAEPAAQKDSPAETPEEQTEDEPAAEEVAEAKEEATADAPEEAVEERPAEEEERIPAEEQNVDAPSPATEGQTLSPLVRKLAREHDVDVTQLRGTGAGGRVTKDDVMAYVEKAGDLTGGTPKAEPKPGSKPEPVEKTPGGPPPVRAQAQEGAGERTTTEPLTHIRKRIAQHMRASLDTAARAWNAIEVDMEAIARLRAEVGPEFKQREGYSLTYLPFISRAVCDALATYPVMNASLSEDLSEATYHNYVNLGIAVATDYGLIVPVIKGAEALNVVGIARAVRALADRARDKKLDPDDVGGSTFTVTNPGPFDSYLSLPVINQPNVAILATEKVEKRVVVLPSPDGDMIAVRHRMFLSMSWDHRLLDGVPAMQFLQRVKENLETWDFSHEV